MAKSYKNMSIDELIEKYRQGAVIHSDQSDPKKANKGADQVYKCYKILRESQEGRESLISLMKDFELNVRGWAASQCLQWKYDEARRVLEEIRDSQGLFSFSAGMTLTEFDAGRLKLD